MGSLGNAQIDVVEPAQDRAAQKSYWADHSATASVEAMMLDSQAAVIDKEERPEVHPLLSHHTLPYGYMLICNC